MTVAGMLDFTGPILVDSCRFRSYSCGFQSHSCGFRWIPVDSGGFLWIPVDSCRNGGGTVKYWE